ncbi:protein DOWNY MILDEW RESISTANCE 6-like isoform X2 [Cornus florida]|uniref:protein DOWNY MILDEW RESISTANCE 6-like isoform X2 n=1 Tax=Cornus florida TaxID=4283 RepID=UPI00289C76CF|nr:protein DOWNY MILDEW RESISTANCE 6-like isoform X2 [Cornus florida]
MEKLVSNWYSVQSLPETYVFPPDQRPGKLIVPLCKTIPVIDLGKAEDHDQSDIVQQILNASQEFGFFQVINHGVSENLVDDTVSLFKEFFNMPDEDKASVYSEDSNKSCKLFTSSLNYANEEFHLWRDNLRHPCHPLEEWMQFWPEKPTRYREVVGTYSAEVRELSLRILQLICEGLGLEQGYFRDELAKCQLLSVNHYPPCPDPSLTLGLHKHCDPNLITILHQGDVCGLQVIKDGQWIGIEPLPNAFVVNIGYQLQTLQFDSPSDKKMHSEIFSIYFCDQDYQ